jgi:predicted ester cyclase
MLSLAVFVSASPESDFEKLEFTIKSEFIRRFADYIEWPPSAFVVGESTFTTCLVGKGPLIPYLTRNLEGTQIQGRKGQVKTLDSLHRLEGCHVLYVAPSARKNVDRLVHQLGERPVLTIGDTEGYTKNGVMINLFVDGKHVRFSINHDVTKAKGLKVSAKLLVLAKPETSRRF